MPTSTTDRVEGLAEELRSKGISDFALAFVLGSGLGAFAERLDDALVVPFEDLDHMPKSGVPGHAGRFALGTIGGTRVLVQQGRSHLYEGWSPYDVTRSVRAFARLGATGLVLTNAAGGLVPDWPIPSLMRITDHLNLQGRTPLSRGEVGSGTPYDGELGAALDEAARAIGVPLEQGVYAGLLGPVYETPAEIRHLSKIGAHAVGMSTVAEALAANAAGLKVAAVSCISNPAAGISTTPLNHEEVVEAGRQIADRFGSLLERFAAGFSA